VPAVGSLDAELAVDAGAPQGIQRRRITLINLERLVGLWIEFYGKLDDVARRRLPLTPITCWECHERLSQDRVHIGRSL